MKANHMIALPLAAAIVSLVAAPSMGQAAKNPSAKSLKRQSLRDTDVRALLPNGGRMINSEEGGLAGAPIVSECFEGLAVGPVTGQAGWTTFAAALNTPVVSAVGPIEALKSVDLPDDAAVANGTLNGIFSPTFPQVAGDYTGSCKIMVPNLGGADYDVVFQAPSQAFLCNRVKFEFFAGDIFILDDPGTGLAFIDSGADFIPGVTHDLRIELDSTAGAQRYYLDNVLIYTGAIFAGTAFEQAVLFSDSWHLPGEIGKVDCVAFEPGLPGPSCAEDVNGDNVVGVADLLAVIGAWGPCAGCPTDVNNDNVVGVADLLAVIGAWGPC